MRFVNGEVEYDIFEDIPNTSQIKFSQTNTRHYTPLITRYNRINTRTPQV